MNYQLNSKHNIYEKGERDTPYVENVVETVERFNKNIGNRAKNTVNNDEISNIHQKPQDNSFGNQKEEFVPRGENYNFDKEIVISKNKFYGDEKTNSPSKNSYFSSEKIEESKEQIYNTDILQELSDNLEFLSRRGVNLNK